MAGELGFSVKGAKILKILYAPLYFLPDELEYRHQGATDMIIGIGIGRYIGIGRFIGIADMRNAYRYRLLV